MVLRSSNCGRLSRLPSPTATQTEPLRVLSCFATLRSSNGAKRTVQIECQLQAAAIPRAVGRSSQMPRCSGVSLVEKPRTSHSSRRAVLGGRFGVVVHGKLAGQIGEGLPVRSRDTQGVGVVRIVGLRDEHHPDAERLVAAATLIVRLVAREMRPRRAEDLRGVEAFAAAFAQIVPAPLDKRARPVNCRSDTSPTEAQQTHGADATPPGAQKQRPVSGCSSSLVAALARAACRRGPPARHGPPDRSACGAPIHTPACR